MLRFLSVFVLLVATAIVANASDVLVYTDSNFESAIGSHDIALVEFYAPWCGHCKRLAPEYETAATALKNNDPPVPLIKVDCTVETKTCGKYGVSGYPTLKIFKNGEMSADYQGPRESSGIVKYMKSRAGPAFKQISNVEEFEKFLSNNEHSIVAFIKSDTTLEAEFKKMADQLSENYRFGLVSAADLLEKYGYSDKVVIYQPPRLQTPLESKEKAFTGASTLSDLRKFVQTQMHGLAGHRTPSNQGDFSKPTVIVVYNLDYIRDPKGSNYVRNRVIKVAKKVSDITFAVSSIADFGAELEEFGISSPEPTKRYIIGRGPNSEKYVFEGEYSVDNLEKFANDLKAGSLEPYLKSEPIPEPNEEAVVTVVARNFNEVVMDSDKDVLLEFYAPWCGHCKSLAPKYEELAQKLKGEPNVVIAKIDATANDIPPTFQVQGFPTIFFVPANNKNSPKKYDGGREVNDFVKYIAKESTQKLVGFDRKGKKIAKSEL